MRHQAADSSGQNTVELEPLSGWLQNVELIPSPNCDSRPPGSSVCLLVVHGISLPPRQFGGGYVDRLFTNCLPADIDPYFQTICRLRVSAHLFIARDGKITQYVPLHKRAWHAGVSAFNGHTACNDFSIGIELEGCDDQAYEEIQYHALARLARICMTHWPAITPDRIVGHSDIAPGRKTDPGPAFDWEKFRSTLGGITITV